MLCQAVGGTGHGNPRLLGFPAYRKDATAPVRTTSGHLHRHPAGVADMHNDAAGATSERFWRGAAAAIERWRAMVGAPSAARIIAAEMLHQPADHQIVGPLGIDGGCLDDAIS